MLEGQRRDGDCMFALSHTIVARAKIQRRPPLLRSTPAAAMSAFAAARSALVGTPVSRVPANRRSAKVRSLFRCD